MSNFHPVATGEDWFRKTEKDIARLRRRRRWGLTSTSIVAPPALDGLAAYGSLGSVTLEWNGAVETDAVLPSNFHYVEVFASPTISVTPLDDNLVGVITTPGGGMVTVDLGEGVWYLAARIRTTSLAVGPLSAPMEAVQTAAGPGGLEPALRAPTGVSVTPSLRWDDWLGWRADAVVSWSPVTQRVDGTSVSPRYRVLMERADLPGRWQDVGVTDGTTLTLERLQVGVEHCVVVVAQEVSSYDSDRSVPACFTQVGDTGAPAKPNPPEMDTVAAMVVGRWDRAMAPIDLDRVTFHRATTAGFTADESNRVAETKTDTPMAMPSQPEHVPYFYKVVVWDVEGLASPASEASEAVVVDSMVSPEDLARLQDELDAASGWISESGAELEARLDTAFGPGNTWNLTDAFNSLQGEIDSAAGTASAAAAAAAAAQQAADDADAAALAAAGIAAGKGEVIVQASPPTGTRAVPQNLWVRLPDNKPHRWNTATSKWEPITDQAALDAAGAAAAAQAAADTAHARAVAAETNAKAHADAQAEAARVAAEAAAALDATAKAEQAEANAVATAALEAQSIAHTEAEEARLAAEEYARLQASGASADVLAAAKTYAEEQAEEARVAAEAAAALDATAKAEQAEANAAATAALDATAKADAAQAAAVLAAAQDATGKANAARTAAEAAAATHAEAEAEAARLAAIATASGDATSKANAAEAAAKSAAAADALSKANAARDAAIASAKTYADGAAEAARASAVSTAAADATSKANAARTAAEGAAATHASAQAEAARLAAIAAASGDATDKAAAAQAAAIAAAASDALAKATDAKEEAILAAEAISALLRSDTQALVAKAEANSGRIWRQDTAPPAGTTYRWSGTATEKVVDGVVIATATTPGFREWTLGNGATIDAEGTLHLTTPNAVASSPHIPVTTPDSETLQFLVEMKALQPVAANAPDGGLLYSTEYFDANKQPIANTIGYTGNGYATKVPLGVWHARGSTVSTMYVELGPGIAFVRVSVSVADAYSIDARYRNPSVTTGSLSDNYGKGTLPDPFFTSDTPDDRANDLWINTAEGNRPYTWDGSANDWTPAQDASIATAQGTADAAAAAAATAKSTADAAQAAADAADAAALAAAGLAGSKGKVIVQASAPTGDDRAAQNLWIRLPDNVPHRWVSPNWVAVTDKTATDAAAAAATAQQQADDAQDAADAAAAAASAAAAAATAAQQAADDAQREAELVPRPHQSTQAPTTANKMPVNTRWEQIDGTGKVIGIWVQQTFPEGTSWAQRALDLSLLRAGTAVIDNGVIDKLWADVVRSRKITTDMLLVGAGNNLIPDPFFLNPTTGWVQAPPIHATASRSGSPALQVVNTATQQAWYVAPYEFIPLSDGETYRLQMWVKDTTVIPIGGVTAAIRVRLQNGTYTYPSVSNTVSIPANTWTLVDGIVTIPVNAKSGSVFVASQVGNSTGTLTIDYLGVTRATDASLIVDGTIAARHVNAQSVAAEIGEFVEVEAENIKAGVVNVALQLGVGGSVTVGPDTGHHIYIGDGVIEARRNYQGEIMPAVSMGGPNNSFLVYDQSGTEIGGIHGDASMKATEFDADVVRIEGNDIMEVINPAPRGVVAWSGLNSGRGPYSNPRTGVYEIPFPCEGGRRYRISVSGNVQLRHGQASGQIGVIKTQTEDLTTEAPAPHVDNTAFPGVATLTGPMTGYMPFDKSWYFSPARTENTRWLLYMTQNVQIDNNFFMLAEDLGVNPENVGAYSLGGAPGTPPVPPSQPPPKRDYVKEFSIDEHQVWSQVGKGDSYAPNWIRHGTLSHILSIYRTYLVLPAAARAILTPAGNTITRVDIRLSQHGGYAGDPYTATHNVTTFGTGEPAAANTGRAGKTFKPGTTAWFTLSAAQRNALSANTAKGVMIGQRVSTGGPTLQDFHGTAASTSVRPRVKIWYTA